MSSGKNSGWTIEFDEGFADDIKKLDKTNQIRIKKYLTKLQGECRSPRERGSALGGPLAGLWKYRVGDYRILCQIQQKQLVVLCLLMVSHRSNSYSGRNIEVLLKRAEEILGKLSEENKLK